MHDAFHALRQWPGSILAVRQSRQQRNGESAAFGLTLRAAVTVTYQPTMGALPVLCSAAVLAGALSILAVKAVFETKTSVS